MLEQDNVKILELMSSKICHDLISPVGAISNGVEILEEMGGDEDGDIISLIAFSASQANAKLKTLRMAYGLGGADDSIKMEEVHAIFGGFISAEKRLSQDWNPYSDLGVDNKKGLAKIMLCVLILAMEALPKGGLISAKKCGEGTILITASGENANFRDGYLHAIAHTIDIDNLDPKLVHPYITGMFAQKYGFEITIDETENDFIFLRLKSTHVS